MNFSKNFYSYIIKRKKSYYINFIRQILQHHIWKMKPKTEKIKIFDIIETVSISFELSLNRNYFEKCL